MAATDKGQSTELKEGELEMSDVIEIQDEQTWQQDVDQATGRVMVEFFVTWCPHCQREAPILDSVADQIRADGVEVYRANAEIMWTKGEVYGLEETPSFILIDNGELIAKHEGFLTADELVDFANMRGEWNPNGTRGDLRSANAFARYE